MTERQPVGEFSNSIIEEGQARLHPQCPRRAVIVSQQCREAAGEQLESLLTPDVTEDLGGWFRECS